MVGPCGGHTDIWGLHRHLWDRDDDNLRLLANAKAEGRKVD